MKGNDKLLEALNGLLSDELTAMNQYMVHSEMCANWGYEKLHNNIEKRAIHEMKHAEKLIARILFLEGTPIVSKLRDINIGSDDSRQVGNDWKAESEAIKAYNDAIQLAADVGDNVTRDMLVEILKDEDLHIDNLEGINDQMGISIFLSTQT